MNLSRRWLEAFLGRALDPRELADRLAMLVGPVDAVEPLHQELTAIVVARVDAVRPHPNADRLRLCTVSHGADEPSAVVCGAPNVEAGGWYPFAPVGASLPGGLRIEKRKIRGETSHGMLCSARELGLGEDHDGILALDGPFTPGEPFLAALALDDHRLLLDVPPNRPDLLGHKGVARELAAALGVPFRLPALPLDPGDLPGFERTDATEGTTDGIRVAIEPGAGCGRFIGAVVRGVRVGPSPAWLRHRLAAVGLRSINNVVDATNWVMFELGQPLHAYDLATLRGGLVAARSAGAGESVVTLDGERRALAPGHLVIADGEGVIGVAGVMGGEATEVNGETRDLFLEGAWFQPRQVRASRRALGLSTDASYRFERGVDKWNTAEAVRRCLAIILGTAGGTLAAAPVDVWPDAGHPPRIFLRRGRVAQVLGIDLAPRVIEESLVAIGATVVSKPDDGRLAVEVPGWRPDLTAEIDLVEEVARTFGYEKIPDDLRPYRPGLRTDAPGEIAADRVRRGLVAEGLLEAVTLPLGPPDPEGSVALHNPLSADHAHLRRRLLPGLVREAERNWAAHTRDVRLFEVGTVFEPVAGRPRPAEATHVAAVVTGGRHPGHWTGSGRAPDLDPWDLKGLLETAVSLANPSGRVQVAGSGWDVVTPDGRTIGHAGPVRADAPKWAAPLFGLELRLDPEATPDLVFRPYPATPSAERDLALVVRDAVPAGAVLATARAAGGALLESLAVVDEYRGRGIPEGARSLAIRLVFRSPERTLRDAEIDDAIRRLCGALEREHGIVLRTS